MSEQINDGGQAFPHQYSTRQGMTLRDYFAAQAMHTLLEHVKADVPFRFVAEESFRMADAMIAGRDKQAK